MFLDLRSMILDWVYKLPIDALWMLVPRFSKNV